MSKLDIIFFFVKQIKTKVEGGKITQVLYAGGETVDNEVTGKINGNIELTVLDGDINKIEAGTSGGPQSPATDIITAEINNELAEDNLELVGFYLDKEFTQEFDFSTPIDQDLELYMKLKEVTPTEDKNVENPNTSDVNIFLILSLVAVGAFGTTLVLKNRLS